MIILNEELVEQSNFAAFFFWTFRTNFRFESMVIRVPRARVNKMYGCGFVAERLSTLALKCSEMNASTFNRRESIDFFLEQFGMTGLFS